MTSGYLWQIHPNSYYSLEAYGSHFDFTGKNSSNFLLLWQNNLNYWEIIKHIKLKAAKTEFKYYLWGNPKQFRVKF